MSMYSCFGFSIMSVRILKLILVHMHVDNTLPSSLFFFPCTRKVVADGKFKWKYLRHKDHTYCLKKC